RATLVDATVTRLLELTDDTLHALNEAAFHETRRLDRSRDRHDQEELEYWRSLARRLGKMGRGERQQTLAELARRYAEDIAGNFDPRVFDAATRLIPPLVTGLLTPSDLPRFVKDPRQLLRLDAIAEKVQVQGPVEELRSLAEKGTLVFVPTHSSNLDSIVFGFALEASGLPPATYGAGKNLFTNPLLSFFMHNLGAYRVDRRLRHRIYKDCLKAYSTLLIERGFHSLFFPGGTRSRSGAVEPRLKLGLMGTALEAYTRSLIAGRERKVFFVPSTINYLITLEAETLIDDFLTEAGKARFIIDDDESTRLGRVASFARKLLGMEGAVIIRFGPPCDPFGNRVDAQGMSHDPRGRVVATDGYVRNVTGDVVLDAKRDAEYTRELGRELADAFARETVIMPTNVVAAACFDTLRSQAPSGDLFTVLRVRDAVVPRDSLAGDVTRIRDQLLDLETNGLVHLAGSIRHASGGDIVAQAMAAFSGYHSQPVISPRKDGIGLSDPKLLFYYQNRIAAHGLAYDPQRALGGSR
ncbi:MAG: 1-acyl-sn-glycerol-3-phosphate acyltransferase, partial [Myxococcota bacterium]